MLFKRIAPSVSIQPFIECYWIVEDDDTTPVCQKIIPDGFPEIIVHYGDPYKILIKDEWEQQADFLLAGQLTKFFYLENTGKTGVLGIKLKPTVLSRLFGLSMKEYTDTVVSIREDDKNFTTIKQIGASGNSHEKAVQELNQFFEAIVLEKKIRPTALDQAVNLVFERKGMVNIRQLAAETFLSERQLLNQFRQQVGLSPKLLARIVRLNYIFQLVKENKEKWTSLAYEAAYFDQSHFIKDFKQFTGESPHRYAFDEENLANFFLMPRKKSSPS
jgi:AraC-like DNA-binding protein